MGDYAKVISHVSTSTEVFLLKIHHLWIGMPLVLEEGVKADVPAFVDCFFEAYSHPYHPFFDLLYPGAGHNVQESKPGIVERVLERWNANPYQRWAKVLDSKTGQVIGASRWELYPENPFPAGAPHTEATWYPEGSLIREYTTFLMNDRLVRQVARCAKPHAWLATMGVRPSYRRHGVASQMVKWGVQQAERMGVEMFVEASWHGSQVYRQFGFQYVDKFHFKRPPEKEGDAEWDELEKRHPFEADWFWRPKTGSKTEEEHVLETESAPS